MSDANFQHEIDDELLSAYLDDELAPEERAAVVLRVSNDPVAQQLLHQLRSVSQSVQRLPLEPVGKDLRAEILRRVESIDSTSSATQGKAGGSTADDKPARLGGDALPKLTIFQTRRAWIWASLAVAASLMIMLLQPGDENQKTLPAVAQRHKNVAAERQLEDLERSQDKPASQSVESDASELAQKEKVMAPQRAPSAPIAEAPAAAPPSPSASESSTAQFDRKAGRETKSSLGVGGGSEATAPVAGGVPVPAPSAVDMAGSRGGRTTDSRAESLGSSLAVPSARSAAAAPALAPAMTDEGMPSGQLAKAPLAETRSFGGQAGAPRGALHAKAGPQNAEWDHPGSEIIVYVVAKPEAYANGSFDELLKNRGINIETPQRDVRLRSRDVASDKLAMSVDNPLDVILVEAPESSIISCLTDLQRDSANYAGFDVEVDAADDSDRNSKVAKLDRPISELQKYRRGAVSTAQKEAIRSLYANEADLKQTQTEPGRYSVSTGGASPARTGVAPEQQGQGPKKESFAANRSLVTERYAQGSAGAANQPASTAEASTASSEESRAMRRAQAAPEKHLEGTSNNLRVLFVVIPQQVPVAGPAAAKPAE